MSKLFRQTSETTKLYIKVIFPTKIYNSPNRRIFSDARAEPQATHTKTAKQKRLKKQIRL